MHVIISCSISQSSYNNNIPGVKALKSSVNILTVFHVSKVFWFQSRTFKAALIICLRPLGGRTNYKLNTDISSPNKVGEAADNLHIQQTAQH